MTLERKIYDRDLKIKAVLLSYETGSICQVSRELKMPPVLLTKWRKEYQQFGTGSFCGGGKVRIHPDKENLYRLEKKLKESELKFEILKKGLPNMYQGNLMIFQFIKSNEKNYRIRKMCTLLGVSNTSYCTWKRLGITKTKKRIILLKEEITSIFLETNRQYGRYRMTNELQSRGFKISERQVRFYMQQLDLRRKVIRKFKVTTNSNHIYNIAPHILNQEFKVTGPSKVWVSDITYIRRTIGFSYLTIIMDLFDRKIIGWSLSNELKTTHTLLDAWEMAVKNRKISNGLIFHSDRGVQYASNLFVNKINSYKCITRSMSRKGNHLDNAVSESFFNTLKRELIHKIKPLTRNQLKEEIFEFIENWYNKKRIHSTLHFKTIEEFNVMNQI